MRVTAPGRFARRCSHAARRALGQAAAARGPVGGVRALDRRIDSGHLAPFAPVIARAPVVRAPVVRPARRADSHGIVASARDRKPCEHHEPVRTRASRERRGDRAGDRPWRGRRERRRGQRAVVRTAGGGTGRAARAPADPRGRWRSRSPDRLRDRRGRNRPPGGAGRTRPRGERTHGRKLTHGGKRTHGRELTHGGKRTHGRELTHGGKRTHGRELTHGGKRTHGRELTHGGKRTHGRELTHGGKRTHGGKLRRGRELRLGGVRLRRRAPRARSPGGPPAPAPRRSRTSRRSRRRASPPGPTPGRPRSVPGPR
ncbi:hypothetical protein BG845_02107 [Pseudonocardia autotrophica]|uniref:Uncharacterized protein n=1 Tax=Pseudonocardia autotrophica TaxID=2074 RepID=A0A1Y2N172_PSEAH|nr:hypothetical protein BG845_02107 [Pseudonocardia autotrophica]